MAKSARLRTLVIGSTEGMESAVGTAAGLSGEIRLRPALTELTSPSGDFLPDLILACQHWPDEYTAAEVELLIARFPLARIVCCYGPWCVSDGRTRNYWPAAVRVPIEVAPDRIRLESRVIAGEIPPLPLTAGLDEVFAFDCQTDEAI
jgi:hypothetical protein